MVIIDRMARKPLHNKERTILPGFYETRPCSKNFLVENIKMIRELQRQVQKKILQSQSHSQQVNWAGKGHKHRRVQKVGSEPSRPGSNEGQKSLVSRLSTPITLMASNRPMRNQKIQTVANKNIRGKVMMPSEQAVAKPLPVPVPEPEPLHSDSESESETEGTQEEVPIKIAVLNRMIKDEHKDFVKYNAYRIYPERPKPIRVDRTLPPPNYRKGELPKYLEEMKKSKMDETGDATVQTPPVKGHIKLTEEERKEHLNKFKSTYAELIRQLQNLPVRSDSYKIRQRKIEIETELSKMEEAMKLFSRDKLYLRVG